ncbi:hypothetical protein GLOTRDRAFT_44143 [Gloeophyllum trabeum ATCC 11539]|uniref:Arrestin-like N-terminal domain-containing protein n=1 Tax=Gloeophyllum trabeum (strain ATCC 11539 / FP-39264 / Madison 617) TaxID=670483 RepID=S7Q1R6_GLOTA|nr:uncharacterized protein GLOTRDRAFT_44143 [Gloeophyllum trabeum ATCC 11539]EPQ53926.1 hypothetical protein GLOTRDRAFT_44143 [Gloeophyllum trabeum ATCC 11539]
MVVDDALPSYTREDSNLQIRSDGPGGAPSHECSLESKGKKWLNLIIKNSRAASTRSLPIFNDGDAITGTVEVELDKPDGIKSVAVALLGGTTSVGQEEVRFLTEEQLLWASTANDGPLRGQNSWPFSITIPSELPVASKYNGRPGEKYRLPPTFSERASPVYIDYKIVVRVKRGLLRAQSILTQTIGFIPQSTGEVPSSHRQKAYAAGAPLPGPDVDPEGWKVLPRIPMKGTLFGSREVEIQCQLALSVPLTYAVGSRVHLFLTLSGQDQQAIDLLCSHGASRIFLVRSVMAVSPGSKSRSDNTFKTSSSRALRTLQGEIEVKHASTPTFNFPTVSITVSQFLERSHVFPC